MQFSYDWLKTWVNPELDVEKMAHVLTMAGLEVEECNTVAPDFTNVVVGYVEQLEPHPNADRLRVAQVNTGQEVVQIVCGAPNVAVGVKVPCALSGALLPNDFAIKPTKMRGIESNGMLCSAKELGLPEDVDGLLILSQDAPVGVNLRTYLNLDDTLFTLKITPNRADCLSIKGIAREVGALLQKDVQQPVFEPVKVTCQDKVSIHLDAKEACGRYLGRIVKGVNAKAQTPDWMKQRLERSGLRSISAIVDVTNYVMLELGQPMHAFDLDKISGAIHVRMAKEAEQLLCLNEKEVVLSSDTLVIADDQKVLALAGLMGGAASAVTEQTQDVLLESAFFSPDIISGKSRQYGFGSDSSFRFERGVDFAVQEEAIERATALLIDICGGQVAPVVHAEGQLPEQKQVTVRFGRINQILGVTVEQKQVMDILTRLGLAPKQTDNQQLMVTSPSFRFDIALEEDIIEEVGRVYGYENIPERFPNAQLAMLALPETQKKRFDIYCSMAARDYQEIVSYAFVDEQWEKDFAGNLHPIRLQNPIASQMSVMRSTLVGGFIQTLSYNLNRKQTRVRLFEVARVFNKLENGTFVQVEKLGGLAFGSVRPEQWAEATRKVDFFDVKADIESLFAPKTLVFKTAKHPALHPGRTAEIFLNEEKIGFIGELHPQWLQKYDLSQAPIVFEVDLFAVLQQDKVTFSAVSKFQPVRRDLAFVLPESIESAQLINCLSDAANSDLVQEIALFDVYQGQGVPENMKSLAVKIRLQAMDKTLSDEEIDEVIQRLIVAAQGIGATLRA
ncbi:phenylalanine--tRNA ligase subunit beta [Neisseria sp. Ec49-e6-T10]|uniref:phenylalanine--tRNA ligase subunit beta n=1 Tax=Neisseria sp. Ec49-e6-T10 TaxID=3140744 RepID=UPI003EB9C0A0